MRFSTVFTCLFAAALSGCGAQKAANANKPAAAGEEPQIAFVAADDSELESLWTRKTGVDWPSFLGPTGDSKSPETGILTDWPEFAHVPLAQVRAAMRGPVLFDGRNVMSKAEAEAAGFAYLGVGRVARSPRRRRSDQ